MRDKSITKMVDAIVSKDRDTFCSEFDSSVKDRIALEVEAESSRISSNLLKFDDEDTNSDTVNERQTKSDKDLPGSRDNVNPNDVSRPSTNHNRSLCGWINGLCPDEKTADSMDTRSDDIKRLEEEYASSKEKKKNIVAVSKAMKTLKINKEEFVAEIKVASNNFTFKSPADAKKFASAVVNAGIKRKNIQSKGKTITLSGFGDKETEEVVSLLAKDMKAIRENNEFVSIIKDIIENKTAYKLHLLDESSIVLNDKSAKLLVRLHDSLNNDNQETMRNTIFESKNTYEEMINLAKENEDDI